VLQVVAARLLGVGWVSVVSCLVAATTAAADRNGEPQGFPGPDQTVLRVARSVDGLHFEDSGEVAVVGAASPDLTVLPNGDLMVLFDRPTGLSAARSRDGGKTFSSARRVRIRGGSRSLEAQHGDLVAVPGGYFRLFFAGFSNGASNRSDTAVVRSAVTRDGINYRLDRSLYLPLPKGKGLHPVSGWIGDRLHVLVGPVGAESQSQGGVHRVISQDGKRFARLVPLPVSDVSFAGSMIPIDGGARAFVSAQGGMRILESVDGRTWRQRNDARLPVGWDPAVVEVERGRYLMVYCTPRTDEAVASSQLVSDDGADHWTDVPEGDTGGDASEVVVDAASSDAIDAEQTAGNSAAEALPVVVGEAIEGEAVGSEEPATVTLLEDFGADGGTLAGYDPVVTGGYAPLPNFVTKVNYMQWYEVYALGDPDDNAFHAYRAFIPEPHDELGDKPEWPELNNMFTSEDYDGAPGPWDPVDYPEWAASSMRAADLIERYRSATRHANYAQTTYEPNDPEMDPADRDLLIGVLLPSLSSHRAMAKAILADAWRLEGGVVSPERMIDAFETTLRTANHMRQGATLIEDLVGAAISNLTRENARWALKHEVFSADELETALGTLQQYDVDVDDPAHALRGEHAFAMDFTQHVFTPPTADGLPHFNRARVERAFSTWFDGELGGDLIEGASTMTPDDVYATIDAFDSHYRELGEMMRIGYPQVRAADIAALEARRSPTSPVTRAMMPALSRYYQIMGATESARRATQLTYATELFKARNGRYPRSLDELPNERGETMKIDPFTGSYFRYELTDDGPRIYSLSEDGIDSGGIHSPSRGMSPNEPNLSGSDDFVFWPPQHR